MPCENISYVMDGDSFRNRDYGWPLVIPVNLHVANLSLVATVGSCSLIVRFPGGLSGHKRATGRRKQKNNRQVWMRMYVLVWQQMPKEENHKSIVESI